MVDFIGNSVGIADDMREWGQVYGEQDARAQSRWRDRELRRTVDEANRYGRDLAISDQEALAQNAAGFDDMGQVLGGLRPSGAPVATRPGGAAGLATEQQATGGPETTGQTLARGDSGVRALSLTSTETDFLFRHRGGSILAFRDFTQQEIMANPRLQSTLRRGQQYGQLQIEQREGPNGSPVYRVVRREGNGIQDNLGIRQPQTFLGIPVRGIDRDYMRVGSDAPLHRRLVQGRRYREDAAEIARRNRQTDVDIPTTPPSATATIPPANQTAITPEDEEGPMDYTTPPDLNPAPGGLEPPSATDTWYNDTGDTTRRLRPTREMRMIEMTVRDNLRRANIAAQHGQNEDSQRYFAQALQGQAALIGQTRMTLYHAAAGGNLAAGATLIAESMGIPQEAVRIQPTDERRPRFNLQIQNDDGQWITASETPRTQDELLSGLQNLADASGREARTEANTALMEATIRGRTDITVAQIGHQNARLRARADFAIARMNAEARAALARGEGTFHTGEEGDVWFSYRDQRGNPVMDHYSMEEQESPSTNGRGETINVPVGRRATGVVGVGAG